MQSPSPWEKIDLILLRSDQYASVARLFSSLDDHLAVPAVINQKSNGKVYVDRLESPTAAMMQVQHRFYFSGDPGNHAFNGELHRLFTEEIYPDAGGQGAYTAYFAPEWQDSLEGEVLAGFDPIFSMREYYEYDLETGVPAPEPEELPEGLALLPVDAAVAADHSLENLDELLEEMLSERGTVEEFLSRSFGVIWRYQDQVGGWCLSEYNLGDRCEVGIATHPELRRRGLAARITRAFLVQARQHGMRRVGWHCWQSNVGSGATARRAGFQKKADYLSFFAVFNLSENLAVQGEIALHQGDCRGALEWLQRSFKIPGAPAWAYLDAACASANLNQVEEAIHFLDQAVERGFHNTAALEQIEALASLRSHERWPALMAKARSGA